MKNIRYIFKTKNLDFLKRKNVKLDLLFDNAIPSSQTIYPASAIPSIHQARLIRSFSPLSFNPNSPLPQNKKKISKTFSSHFHSAFIKSISLPRVCPRRRRDVSAPASSSSISFLLIFQSSPRRSSTSRTCLFAVFAVATLQRSDSLKR